jgi:hypothetical protein
MSGAVTILNSSSLTMAIVFCLYIALLWFVSRHCRGFWSDAEGITADEFASVLSLGLWIYVGMTMALSGANITATQVDFFEVLTYLPLATVAKQAIARFGFPGKRNKRTGYYGGGGYEDQYGEPYEDETNYERPPRPSDQP